MLLEFSCSNHKSIREKIVDFPVPLYASKIKIYSICCHFPPKNSIELHFYLPNNKPIKYVKIKKFLFLFDWLY